MKSPITIAVLGLLIGCCNHPTSLRANDLLTITSGGFKVGIDRTKGAAITWLSSTSHPGNIVNIADPGRLIQQSYYAGRSIDRTSEGQHKAWSPWTWNPIQGGGVGSGGADGTWARVTKFSRNDNTLYSETIPKLWDMADEEAAAVMRQWTTFEPNIEGVIRVRCEIQISRNESDPWGNARERSQEVPACYFTRNFEHVKSYLGNHQWQTESQEPGPPWGHATPPLKAMAMFEASGQGIAVFSPSSDSRWNFGPHGTGLSNDPSAGPCMHVAPIDHVSLGRRSTYGYRYWLVLGNQTQIAKRLNFLHEAYSTEESQFASASSE